MAGRGRHRWASGPRHRSYRFTVLFFVALLTFGSYFAYDSVGAIAPTLVSALGIGREAIGQMYTVYSVAAILSVFIGGLLIDRIGTRRASLLFSGLVTAGALIVAIARICGYCISAGSYSDGVRSRSSWRKARYLPGGSRGRNSPCRSGSA